jgi:hypothetical protein
MRRGFFISGSHIDVIEVQKRFSFFEYLRKEAHGES